MIVIGAGGSGMLCAAEAGRRGRKVLLLDHSAQLGRKILISGGGRCNFTNLGASPQNYVSENPHFCKSALSRFKPEDFIARVKAHGIAFHEKKLGQLFCDHSARSIVELLRADCEENGVETRLNCQIRSTERLAPSEEQPPGARFRVTTSLGVWDCESLVIATGGLSLPKIGATGLGYEIARQFGLQVTPTAPALDGFVFGPPQLSSETQAALASLSGISVDSVLSCGGKSFRENCLFTHSGLSGPAALQASLHWHPGASISLHLLPDTDLGDWLLQQKQSGRKTLLKNTLAEKLPSRLADVLIDLYFPECKTLTLAQVPKVTLEALGALLKHWELHPTTTVGYSKAEVTRGGVSTDELSSKTLESKKVPGLHFVGEVVDVTGWLGGYNFQWAWASGWAAGQVV